MGAPAPFPAAPFLIGALLKVPVVLCIGLYRGGNRYDLYFEAFADELDAAAPRAQGRASRGRAALRGAPRALCAAGSLQLVQLA